MTTEERHYTKLDRDEVGRLLFHPRVDGGDGPEGSIDIEIEVDKGIFLGGRYHPSAVQKGADILFFHGNGETVADYDAIAPNYTEFGLGFLAVDYRGYGRSTGVPNATAMMKDAHGVLDFAKKFLADQGRQGKLAIMGRSLGSACAIELAAARMNEIDGLIIESGFSRTLPILKVLGIDVEALGITEEDGFGNLNKISSYTKPVLFMHAMKDELISVAEAGELQAECGARSKELQMVPGAGHNTIIERGGRTYFDIISRFCKKLGRPERPKKSGVR